MSAWYRRHPRRALALAAGLGVLAVLVAGEMVLRAVTPGEPFPRHGARAIPLRELPRGSVVTRPPPDERVAGSDGLSDRPVRFATDEDGFIRPSRVHAHPDRTVLFLGGSTTECYYVAEPMRVHARVARRLERATGLRVNALNAAMSGNHSMHSAALLLGKGIRQRPQVVVLMHNVNDLVTLLREGDYWNDNPSRRFVDPGDCQGAGCHLARGLTELSSAAFPALTYRLRHLRAGDEFAAPAVRRDSAALVARFRGSLTGFVQTARAWGIEPVLATQPSRFTEPPPPTLGWSEGIAGTSYPVFRSLFLAFNDATRAVADSLAVPLVDLERALPPEPRYFQDYVHYTDAGSAFVAGAMTARLQDLPQIRRPARSPAETPR